MSWKTLKSSRFAKKPLFRLLLLLSGSVTLSRPRRDNALFACADSYICETKLLFFESANAFNWDIYRLENKRNENENFLQPGMLYWYAALYVPSDSWSLLSELSLKSKSSIVSTFAAGCENCEKVPDNEGRPLPTILPNDPMMLGRNKTSTTVLTTCNPINNGHKNFFKPETVIGKLL